MRMSQIEAQRNNAFYLVFPLQETDAGGDNFKTGASPAVTAYFKDAAGAWTSFVPANAIAEIATTGMYSLDLTAAEMDHDQVLLKFTAATAFDDAVLLRTVGVRLADGVAHGGTLGSSTATLAAKRFVLANDDAASTMLITGGTNGAGIDIQTDGISINLNSWNSHALYVYNANTTPAVIMTSDLGEALYIGNFGDAKHAVFVESSGTDSDAVHVRCTGTGVGIRATGGTNGDGIRSVGQGTGAGVTSTPDAVGFGSGGGASAADIADAVWDEATADHVAAGSFGLLAADKAGYSLSAAGLNSVLIAEPSAPPAFGTGTIVEFVGWLGALSRNEVVVTKTGPGVGTQVVKDDAGTADIGTSAVSRTTSLSTRGKFS